MKKNLLQVLLDSLRHRDLFCFLFQILYYTQLIGKSLKKIGLTAKPSTELYYFPPNQCPKSLLISGSGLTAVWLRKHFPQVKNLFVLAKELYAKQQYQENALSILDNLVNIRWLYLQQKYGEKISKTLKNYASDCENNRSLHKTTLVGCLVIDPPSDCQWVDDILDEALLGRHEFDELALKLLKKQAVNDVLHDVSHENLPLETCNKAGY